MDMKGIRRQSATGRNHQIHIALIAHPSLLDFEGRKLQSSGQTLGQLLYFFFASEVDGT